MAEITGWLLIVAFFIGIFVTTGFIVGWGEAAAIFGVAFALAGVVLYAVKLIVDGTWW